MAEAAARGHKALATSDYELAITEYTAALKVSPTSPDYLIQRASAYQRSKKHPEALADANNAVINAQKRAKREKIVEAQFRRGCALYGLERYGDAAFAFGVVKRMDEKHKQVDMFAGKTQRSMDSLPENDTKRQRSIEETPTEDELNGVVSGEASKGPAGGSSATNGNATTTQETSTAPTAPQQTPREKIRHEWYQSTDKVYFTLLAKGVSKDKAQVDIQERSLSISFPLDTGSSYDFSLEPLFGAVIPDKCIPRILPSKIEVILMKATPGVKWATLESSEPVQTVDTGADGTTEEEKVKSAAFTESKPTGPAYPTSSKSGPKDWDKITKDLRKADNPDAKDSGMDDDDDDDKGGDEANFFFKKLFKGSSPDVQRAMMKSYTESNGTALSTNWDEVSKGKVETHPPDGMEARTWEK